MLSGSEAPVQNGLSDLTVDFATEVGSTNKADVKCHNPGPIIFFAVDRQLCTKVNVPSYRLHVIPVAGAERGKKYLERGAISGDGGTLVQWTPQPWLNGAGLLCAPQVAPQPFKRPRNRASASCADHTDAGLLQAPASVPQNAISNPLTTLETH